MSSSNNHNSRKQLLSEKPAAEAETASRLRLSSATKSIRTLNILKKPPLSIACLLCPFLRLVARLLMLSMPDCLPN